MNAQIGKSESNKFGLYNLSNRISKYLANFLFPNKLTCLNTKFKKGRENHGPTPTQIILKHSEIIYS